MPPPARRFGRPCREVHVIVFNSLPSGEVVMNQCLADAQYIVRTNRRSNSAATDCYAAIYRAFGHCLAMWDGEIRIVVVGIQAVSAEIHDLVPCRTDSRDEFFLKCKPAMICHNSYTRCVCPY